MHFQNDKDKRFEVPNKGGKEVVWRRDVGWVG